MPSLHLLPLAGQPEIPLYAADRQQLHEDIVTVSRLKLAESITGGIAFTSKMGSAPTWGIPVDTCKTGMILAQKAGTVCESCYAAKGTFRFGKIQEKLKAAYAGLFHPLWTPAMIQQIGWHATDRFRWFHSGDLQGINHLRNIVRCCLETPWVAHWLPTREKDFVLKCPDPIPDNLTIRASGNRVDGPPPSWWPSTSTVVTSMNDDICPSSVEGGSCDQHECTRCWDRGGNVAYLAH